ncbi:histidine phosphatase family protein [Ferruginibacter sp. SUN106]|uniref:histidine phosphatase family protein n=1 Tax=Ferruginibacter sp. SUN106 TaxID=2978348 RepID=UPI003D35DC92
MLIRKIFFAWLLATVVTSCQVAKTTRIFIVRHADRLPTDGLKPEGIVRAEELKRVLGNAGIDSIFSTDFVRTTKTVQPIADQLHLPVILYSNNTLLLTRILNNSKGKTLLVAGHSDTVPELIQQCGCTPPFPVIPDTQFDNLFLVILQKEKINHHTTTSCKVLRLRYGAVTN